MTEDAELKKKFFSIIDSLGITANIMISPAHPKLEDYEFHEPLVLKWGYVENIDGLEEFFYYVVSTFKSPIQCTLETFTALLHKSASKKRASHLLVLAN